MVGRITLMEENLINDKKLKENISNTVVAVLLDNKLINENDLTDVNVNFGYLFAKADGIAEGLLKISCKGKSFYFAVQDNTIKLLTIGEVQYQETINYMVSNHDCLKETPSIENEKEKNRRIKNNRVLEQFGITTNDKLVSGKNEQNIRIKSVDEICKRAIASLITIQVACDINNGKDIKSDEYKDDFEFIKSLYKKFGVEDSLNSKEKRIIEGTYTDQDPIDMDWAYESYWTLCWALGLVNDITNAAELCDCSMAISFVTNNNSFEEFKSKCKLRSVEEILDMYDLYYKYHWAINDKMVNPSTSADNLNPSNVLERRRALEWLISDVDDWYDLQLNA